MKKVHRVFVSFGGSCPFQCNHCYTFINEFKNEYDFDILNIVNSIKEVDFNTIYVSGYYENFYDNQKGYDLVKALYNQYKCNILFTTRNLLNDKTIYKLKVLNESMRNNGHYLFACVSISATNSYKKLEPNPQIPSPNERLELLKQLNKNGIYTFLTLRPVFPDSYIPTEEYIDLVRLGHKYCNGVISSGVVLNEDIIKRLPEFSLESDYKEGVLMKCLNHRDISVKYINVNKELNFIKEECKKYRVPFFKKSEEALEHIINQ